MNAEAIVFKVGVLKRAFLTQCYDKERQEIQDLRRWWDKPIYFGANFLSGLSLRRGQGSQDGD
jgi:hypothetical protein